MKPRGELRCVVCHSVLVPGARENFGSGTGDLYCPNSPGGFMFEDGVIVLDDGRVVGVAHSHTRELGWYVRPEDVRTPGYVLCDPLVDLVEEAKLGSD